MTTKTTPQTYPAPAFALTKHDLVSLQHRLMPAMSTSQIESVGNENHTRHQVGGSGHVKMEQKSWAMSVMRRTVRAWRESLPG